ncbi:hypothetical protein LNP05_29500 [Klebsiella pneumoniae subsp. pneumoniae]|nr:hypothetical protein [Klebsiella pneumoniae subsp. pneumoniae]
MKLPIYLDYSPAAVDRVLPRKMMQFLTMDGTFSSPAPFHRFQLAG